MDGFLNSPGEYHHLGVEVLDDTIKLDFDGQWVFQHQDSESPFLNGKVGLVAFANNLTGWHEVYFDNLEIREIVAISSLPESLPGTLQVRAFPNPFNPRITISYELPKTCEVAIEVFDVRGRLVKTLQPRVSQSPGRYEVQWRGTDNQGSQVSSGIYLYRLVAGENSEVQRVTLLK